MPFPALLRAHGRPATRVEALRRRIAWAALSDDPVEDWKSRVRGRIRGDQNGGHSLFAPPDLDAQNDLIRAAVISLAGLALVALGVRPLQASLAAFTVFIASAASRGYEKIRDARPDVRELVAEAESELQTGSPMRAARLSLRGLDLARSRALRRKLLLILAWAAIEDGDPFLAHGAMLELSPDSIDLKLLTAYLTACGRNDEAAGLLHQMPNAPSR